ncbi:MAG: hypothetical protein RLZZ292_1358 [Bacteroidota bacterium]|jgi:predicted short-subunit dehydrogenase-like oxidoreductase (DUF2520 family)
MKKIVLLGTGNVAHHLAHRFQAVGIPIAQIYGRTLEKATTLAQRVGSHATDKLEDLVQDADLYILAVSDNAIEALLQEISIISKRVSDGSLRSLSELPPLGGGLGWGFPPSPLGKAGEGIGVFVHTSGTIPSTIFENHTPNYGVFYPLQTFSIGKEPDWTTIPICIDANTEEQRIVLENLARQLSPNVHRITDAQRATLHVAAVFVNNFTNHLFHIGQTIVEKEGVSFDLLKPLIQETVAKIQHNSPQAMQTGPAKRGDTITIEKHKTFLKKYPLYKKIYYLLTKSIVRGA